MQKEEKMSEYYRDEAMNQQAKRINILYKAGVMPETITQILRDEGYECKSDSGWSEGIVKDVVEHIREVESSWHKERYPLSTISAEIRIALNTPLALVFCGLAILMLLGGMSFMQELWPDSAALEGGYQYTAAAYTPAASVFMGTILSSAFLFWMGAVMVYLKAIAIKNIGHFME